MGSEVAAGFPHVWRTTLLFVFLSVFAQSIQAQGPNPTTVSIFLPGYNATQWSWLRGSIVSSNDVETTYTIFCASVTSGCQIGGGTLLPFVFAEGPSTMHFERTVESTISATSACALSGTTAATCHGTISLGAVAIGPTTGPTAESTPPFTLAGSDIARLWGVLTLDEPPLTSVDSSGSRTYTYYPSQATGLLEPGFSSVGSAVGTGGGVGSGSAGATATVTETETGGTGAATEHASGGRSGAGRLGVGGEGWAWGGKSAVAVSLVLAGLISGLFW
ncbi:hypothetical protein F5Y05DRAFT_105915 [Hypoxylon sp. FL0543]|nr:hypothetical protein F5Y05DRAFT_105915 [Hypoxylon sp. FL0543]